jgi:hypothetical protein
MANYATVCNGRSPAFNVDGSELVEGPMRNESVVMATVNMTMVRSYRKNGDGAIRLQHHPLLELCDPIKNPQFNAVNPLGRPMHGL